MPKLLIQKAATLSVAPNDGLDRRFEKPVIFQFLEVML